MLQTIKEILLLIVDNIDTGSSYATQEELEQILLCLKKFTDKDKYLSKYQACRYLNISRATFDNYVRDGKIPKGCKQPGFKELSWRQRDLDNYIKSSK